MYFLKSISEQAQPRKLKKGNHISPHRVLLGMILISLSLAACAKSPLKIPEMKLPALKTPLLDVDITSSLSGEVVKGDYITAYSRIALGLRQCWLGDDKPLKDSRFFARNKADGSDKKSDIFVHRPAIHPKRGPRIFSIHLKPRPQGTEVRMDNRLLDDQTETNLTKDIRRWITGGEGCLQHADTSKLASDTQTKKQGLKIVTSKISLPKKK